MPKKPANKLEREHMGLVAAIGCIVCRSPACIHHIRDGIGLGMRASHFETIPLCHHHHQGVEGIHTLGTKIWQGKYGSERELLKKTLYMVYGSDIPLHVVSETKRKSTSCFLSV